jgi:phosphoribosylformylglycinamidine synthase
VVLRYCEAGGAVTPAANPNGSVGNVAGVRNAGGNVMGLMPHPEHAVEELTGGTDGLLILGSLVDAASAAGGRR